MARFPNAEEFLVGKRCRPSACPTLQNLDTASQQAILAVLHQEMQAPLHEVMQGDQVVFSFLCTYRVRQTVTDSPIHGRSVHLEVPPNTASRK